MNKYHRNNSKPSKSTKSTNPSKSSTIKILRTIPHISDSLSQTKFSRFSHKFEDELIELETYIADSIFGDSEDYLNMTGGIYPGSNDELSSMGYSLDDPFAMNVPRWEDLSIIRIIDSFLPYYHKKYQYFYFPQKTIKSWHVLKRELYIVLKHLLNRYEIGGLHDEKLLSTEEIYNLLLCLKMRIEDYEMEDENFGYIHYLERLYELHEKYSSDYEKVANLLMDDDDEYDDDEYEDDEYEDDDVGESACISHYPDSAIDSYFSKITAPITEDYFLYKLSYIIKESLETFTEEFPRIRGFRKSEISKNTLKLMEIAKSNLEISYMMSQSYRILSPGNTADGISKKGVGKGSGSKAGKKDGFEYYKFENIISKSIFPEQDEIKEVFPKMADSYRESLHQIIKLNVDLFLTTCNRCPYQCLSHYKESY